MENLVVTYVIPCVGERGTYTLCFCEQEDGTFLSFEVVASGNGYASGNRSLNDEDALALIGQSQEEIYSQWLKCGGSPKKRTSEQVKEIFTGHAKRRSTGELLKPQLIQMGVLK